MSDHRETDAELDPNVRAELISSRRGRPVSMKFTIPLALLAAGFGWMGMDATQSRENIETRLQETERAVAKNVLDTAVIRSEQQNIQRSLDRIEAALEELRRERARR